MHQSAFVTIHYCLWPSANILYSYFCVCSRIIVGGEMTGLVAGIARNRGLVSDRSKKLLPSVKHPHWPFSPPIGNGGSLVRGVLLYWGSLVRGFCGTGVLLYRGSCVLGFFGTGVLWYWGSLDLGIISPWEKRPGREAGHSLQCSAKAKSEFSCTCTCTSFRCFMAVTETALLWIFIGTAWNEWMYRRVQPHWYGYFNVLYTTRFDLLTAIIKYMKPQIPLRMSFDMLDAGYKNRHIFCIIHYSNHTNTAAIGGTFIHFSLCASQRAVQTEPKVYA
jgi:hypothetical protein